MRDISKIGDRWTKSIEKYFLKWARTVRINDHPPYIVNYFDHSRFIKYTFIDAYNTQYKNIEDAIGIGIKYDLLRPETIRWLDLYAGTRVQYITEQTASLIREITLQGTLKGLTSYEQAQQIKMFIGLLPRHYVSIMNRAQKLLESGESKDTVQEFILKKSERLRKWRAETIALTEGHTAANEGLRAANTDAVNRGILDTHKYVRQWLVTPDERLCPRCMQMHKTTASLPSGTFPNGLNGPPLHPRCRCTEILVKI